jgi:hypothetical protein
MQRRQELGYRGALKAREIVKTLGIRDAKDIDVEAIAAHFDLIVLKGMLSGAQGRLVRNSKGGVVRLRSDLEQVARRRFVVAHELGHHLLHPSRVAFCAEGDLVRYEPGNGETEANAFAAELLMPRRLFEPDCDAVPSLERVALLAQKFGATLTATAIRFVELAPESCAVVWSEAGKVKWAITGREFPFIRFGQVLSSYSHAHDAFRGRPLPTSPQPVPADAWTDRSGELIEDSRYFDRFGAVLTLLWRRDVEE